MPTFDGDQLEEMADSDSDPGEDTMKEDQYR